MEDLLLRLPRRYEDRATVMPIARIKAGEHATVIGEVVTSGIRPTRRPGFRLFELVLKDPSGLARAVFPNQAFLRDVRGRVILEGVMQAGSDGVVFTLLDGYRPAETLMFCCWSGGGTYRVDVRANGEGEVQASNAVFSSLCGISFYAAA